MLSKPLKALVVEDHPIYLNGLQNYLTKNIKGIDIRIAKDGELATTMITEEHFDLTILDIGLPKVSGMEVARYIKEKKIRTKIIINSFQYDYSQLCLLESIGVDSILLKTDEESELIKSIQIILKDSRYYSHSIRQQFNKYNVKLANSELTKTELQVALLICNGLSSVKIAKKMNISINTVFSHRKSIFTKCEVHNVTELVNHLVKNGLWVVEKSDSVL